MKWKKQAGNITTNLKVKIDFTLTTLSTTNDMILNFRVDDYANGRYYMILGKNILTEVGFSEHVIEAYDGPFNGSTTPMVDLGEYIFKDLNTGEITP